MWRRIVHTNQALQNCFKFCKEYLSNIISAFLNEIDQRAPEDKSDIFVEIDKRAASESSLVHFLAALSKSNISIKSFEDITNGFIKSSLDQSKKSKEYHSAFIRKIVISGIDVNFPRAISEIFSMGNLKKLKSMLIQEKWINLSCFLLGILVYKPMKPLGKY